MIAMAAILSRNPLHLLGLDRGFRPDLETLQLAIKCRAFDGLNLDVFLYISCFSECIAYRSKSLFNLSKPLELQYMIRYDTNILYKSLCYIFFYCEWIRSSEISLIPLPLQKIQIGLANYASNSVNGCKLVLEALSDKYYTSILLLMCAACAINSLFMFYFVCCNWWWGSHVNLPFLLMLLLLFL